jgi:hypothetical protein
MESNRSQIWVAALIEFIHIAGASIDWPVLVAAAAAAVG